MNYRDLLSAIPKDLYQKNELRGWLALGTDFVLFFLLCMIILKIDHIVIGSLLGLTLLGLVLTGIFVIGHDAGHRSFSNKESTNDLVGHLTTSFLGWPFHLWRLAHNVHHLHTNHAKKDVAWEPHTNEQIQRLPAFFRITYTKVRSKLWAYWTGAFFHNFELWLKYFQGKLFKKEDRAKIAFSIGLTIIATGFYAFLTYWVGGWYGLITLFILPQMGFYFWMTTFTLLHHTHPDHRFLNDQEWNFVTAQLDGTIHVKYGRFVDFMTHDIAWHIPHHISVGIPFYHLKKAHGAIKKAFPDRVNEERFTLGLLVKVLGTCQAVDNFDQLNWTSFQPAPIAKSEGNHSVVAARG